MTMGGSEQSFEAQKKTGRMCHIKKDHAATPTMGKKRKNPAGYD